MIAAILSHKSFFESINIFRMKKQHLETTEKDFRFMFLSPLWTRSLFQNQLFQTVSLLSQKLLPLGSQSLPREHKDLSSLVLAT